MNKFKNEIEQICNALISDMSNLQNVLNKVDLASTPQNRASYDFYKKMRVNMANATKVLMDVECRMDKYAYTEEMNKFLAGRIKTLEEELDRYRVVEELVFSDELDNILSVIKNKEELVKKYSSSNQNDKTKNQQTK